jgi:nucleotide-binding universal stress UspA family protein
MKLLNHILLSSDFSHSSKNLVDTAIEIAKVLQTKIIPMHVLPGDITDEKVHTQLENMTRDELAQIKQEIEDAGVESGNPIIQFGSVSDAIVRIATAVKTNLIVIGSGESYSKERFKLGTTAKRIIQKSEKPVFVVKEDTPLNIQNILCPVDFSDTSKRALQNAITLSHRYKAELTIMSVFEPPSASWFTSEEEREAQNDAKYAEFQSQFDEFLKDFNLVGLNWKKELPKGIPSEEILNTISSNMIDLLVMGTVGRTGLNRMIMGSVTEKVIREVPCSFLTMKSENMITLQLESNIRDIQNLYQTAVQLTKDGFHEDAIDQLKACLNINNMHVPAYLGIAKIYERLNDEKNAKRYREKGMEIKEKFWYLKIEQEIRKLKGS